MLGWISKIKNERILNYFLNSLIELRVFFFIFNYSRELRVESRELRGSFITLLPARLHKKKPGELQIIGVTPNNENCETAT